MTPAAAPTSGSTARSAAPIRDRWPIATMEPAATYERASDEHGRLAVSAATNRLALGDKLRLIPGHCDPTVNLHDWYVCIRGGRVEPPWPITARRDELAHSCGKPWPNDRAVKRDLTQRGD